MAVRRAEAGEAGEVARVQTASWEGVYRGKVPDALFDFMTLERRVEIWSRYLANPPERTSLLVAIDGTGEIVGMACTGRNRDDDLGDDAGELLAIYVHPASWGHGFGRELMIRAIEELRGAGFTLGTLWVLEGNARGRAFYEAGGWYLDGSTKLDASFGAPISEVRYRFDLTD